MKWNVNEQFYSEGQKTCEIVTEYSLIFERLFSKGPCVLDLAYAPVTFQWLMEGCMGELHLNECLVYKDDILIFSDALEGLFRRLEAVFRPLELADSSSFSRLECST